MGDDAAPVSGAIAELSVARAAATIGMSRQRLRAIVRGGVVATLDFPTLSWLRAIATLEPVPTARQLGHALAGWRRHAPDGRSPSAAVWRWHRGRLVADGWELSTGQRVLALHPVQPRSLPTPVAARGRTRAVDAVPLSERLAAAAAIARDDAVAGCRAYVAILRGHPDAPAASLNLGRILHGRGKLRWAHALYERAARADPAAATPWFNLGVLADDRGATGVAAAHYRRALQRDPGLADAHFNLARLHEREGDEVAATRHWIAYRRHRGS